MTDPTPSPLAGLIKRLKAVVPYQGKSEVAFLCHEAADVISDLTALRERSDSDPPTAEDYRNRAERAEAECADVRAKALEEAAKVADGLVGDDEGREIDCCNQEANNLARELAAAIRTLGGQP